MANNDKQSRPPLRFMRLKDIVETSDEVISFVDKYQKVWDAEGKAMIALGEFLTLRSESMRYQVEMSADLSTWIPLGSEQVAIGSDLTVSDTSASGDHRFYRARISP